MKIKYGWEWLVFILFLLAFGDAANSRLERSQILQNQQQIIQLLESR
jgi:hypothetical protein